MKIWRKNSVKWTLNGKRVSPNTEGAKKRTIPSKRFYGTVKTYEGKRRQTPLTEDTETSRQLLRRLQAEEDRRKALGIDRYTINRQRPLTELLTEYERFLRSKNNTERYVSLTTSVLFQRIWHKSGVQLSNSLLTGKWQRGLPKL